MLLYEPSYLADVIEYYAPGITARPLGTPVPAAAGTVWVLATDRVVNTQDTAAKVGSVLADLEQGANARQHAQSLRTYACGSCDDDDRNPTSTLARWPPSRTA